MENLKFTAWSLRYREPHPEGFPWAGLVPTTVGFSHVERDKVGS